MWLCDKSGSKCDVLCLCRNSLHSLPAVIVGVLLCSALFGHVFERRLHVPGDIQVRQAVVQLGDWWWWWMRALFVP